MLQDCVAVVAFLDRALDSFHVTVDAAHSGQKLLATAVGYVGHLSKVLYHTGGIVYIFLNARAYQEL